MTTDLVSVLDVWEADLAVRERRLDVGPQRAAFLPERAAIARDRAVITMLRGVLERYRDSGGDYDPAYIAAVAVIDTIRTTQENR